MYACVCLNYYFMMQLLLNAVWFWFAVILSLSMSGSGSISAGSYNINNILLKSMFPVNGEKLNICHFNAGSLKAGGKIDEVRQTFLNTNIHVIAVTETWFNTTVTNSSMNIDGYRLYRNDRFRKVGGGVAFYIRDNLKVSKIVSCSKGSIIEHLFVEILTSNIKILIGVVYNPNVSNDITALEEKLSELTPLYNDVILTGDFNTDLLSVRPDILCKVDNFKSMINSLGLVVLGSEPTHFTGSSSSLLDLFIVKSGLRDKVLGNYQICFSGISKHDLIGMSYICPTPLSTPKTYCFRDFNAVDRSRLHADCMSLPWNSMFYMANVDDMVSHFNSLVMFLFNSHVPLRQGIVSEKYCPWFSKTIETSIKQREIAFKNWKLNRTNLNFETWRLIRNRTNQMICRAKSNYVFQRLNPKLPSKQIFKNLKSFGHIDSSNDKPNYTVDEFNEYFGSVQNNNFDFTSNDVFSNDNDVFSFQSADISEVVASVKRIKSNSTGLDDISIKFVKMILLEIAPFLTHIFNHILASSVYPTLWKTAKILPVHKKANSYEITDYRPISLLASLSKALEHIMKSQINAHLNRNSLLMITQSGFRKHHSTESTLLKITDDLRIAMDNKSVAALVLLDFSKAFDCVHHKLLLHKLGTKFKFSSSAINLMGSYLNGRKQCVSVEGFTSSLCDVLMGVPQGSVLGPLLFSMFINDLPTVLKSTTAHLYADDFQLYSTGPFSTFSNNIRILNLELDAIYAWTTRNGLHLNANKSQLMFISSDGKRGFDHFPPIFVNNERILPSNTVRNLGIVLNRTLGCQDHVKMVSAKVYSILARLWRLSSCTPFSLRKRLVVTLCIPHLTYCTTALGSLDQASKRKVALVFNACIRYVYSIRKFDSVRLYEKAILGCTFENYCKYLWCVYLYKIIHHLCPSYLYVKLSFSSSLRTVNLNLPLNRTSALNFSFFVRGPSIWNALPPHIKLSTSLKIFKKTCIEHFCSLQ